MTPEEARATLQRFDAKAAELGSAIYRPHIRTPKQAYFASLTHEEAFYGGAAGGGKTDIALDMALEHVHIPGYSAVLFRRTCPQLELDEGFIHRSRMWLKDSPAEYNETKKRWTFPSGSRVSFGHMQYEKDKYDWDGGRFHGVYFDELPHFQEAQYMWLFSRLRRGVDFPIQPIMRGFGSPAGPGHVWVKKRFIDPGHESRPFVPARLEDNPYIDQLDYERKLEKLRETDPVAFRQLRLGEWVLDTGGLVYPYRDQNLIAWVPPTLLEELTLVLGVDLGASEQEASTAFVVLGYHAHLDAVFVVQSEAKAGMIPTTIAGRIKELDEQFAKPALEARRKRAEESEGIRRLWHRELSERLQRKELAELLLTTAPMSGFEFVVVDEGALGKGYAKEFRVRHGIPVVPAEKAQKVAFRRHLRGALEEYKVLLVGEANSVLLEEMATLQWDETGAKVQEGASEHSTDALLYGWRACRAYAHEPLSHRARPGSLEWAEEEEERMEEAAIRKQEEERDAPWWQ